MSNRTTLTKTITLEKNLVKKIEELAMTENRNFSNMIETLLKKQLKI